MNMHGPAAGRNLLVIEMLFDVTGCAVLKKFIYKLNPTSGHKLLHPDRLGLDVGVRFIRSENDEGILSWKVPGPLF